LDQLDSHSSEAKLIKKSYLTRLKEELKKVTWTEKQELIRFTKAVLTTIFSMGLGIYLVDIGIKRLLENFTRIIQFIFG
jgi:preprotein translocase SecE subunit